MLETFSGFISVYLNKNDIEPRREVDSGEHVIASNSPPHHAATGCAIVRSHARTIYVYRMHGSLCLHFSGTVVGQ